MQEGTSPSPKPISYHDTLLAVLDMLSHGPMMITVDARHPDVDVPEHLRVPSLALLVAYNQHLRKPLLDLEVDASGIRCVMSFSNSPYRIVIPWSRVWRANSDRRSVLWGERVPAEIVGREKPGVLFANSPAPTPTPPRPTHLKLVTDD